MRSLRKLLELPASDRRLLLQAGALLVLVRVGLWVLPFARLRPVLGALGRPAGRGPTRSVEEIGWAVTAASRLVPHATCLAQALAAQTLFARQGQQTALRFGVARRASRHLDAHAWLELDGHVVFGDSNPGRYRPLEESQTPK